MDRFEKKDKVRIKSEWEFLNGKTGTVHRVYRHECDVVVDRKIFFVHKDQLKLLRKSS